MNSTMEHSTDDVLAGTLISVIDTIGFLLIVTVLIGCYRIPAMRGSFGILTANQNFSQLIACVTTVSFYSLGLIFDYRILLENSGYFGNTSALILTVITTNFLLISVNRTCAISFPIYYKLFFNHTMVFILVFACWVVPGGLSCYYIFGLNCRLAFSHFGWLFTSDITIPTCGTKFRSFILSGQSALSFLILMADLTTLALLILKRNSLGSMSADARRTERNFTLQVMLQGVVFNFHSIWISNAFQWLPGEPSAWKLFLTTTFSSNLLMIFDPAVVIIFNREFRHWIFNSRSTVFAATLSASADGRSPSRRSTPKPMPSSSFMITNS